MDTSEAEADAPRAMSENDLLIDEELLEFIIGDGAELASAEPIFAQDVFPNPPIQTQTGEHMEICPHLSSNNTPRSNHRNSSSSSSSNSGSGSSSGGGGSSSSDSGDETSLGRALPLCCPSSRRDKRGSKANRRSKPAIFKETANGAFALVSRKQTIFPNFEKSDILRYLPKVICQCLNEGNFDKLRATINPRSNRDCEVFVHSVQQLQSGPESIVRFFEQMLTVFPDIVCCNTGITSKESTLTAQFSFKRTSVKALFDRLCSPPEGRLFKYGAKSRANWYDFVEWAPHHTEEDKRAIAELLRSDFDLETYGVGYVTMFFDDRKRVCKFQTHCKLISITKLDPLPMDEE